MNGQSAQPAADQLAGLAGFNDVPGAAARRELLACCSSARWAEVMLAGRPYRDVDGLLARSDSAVASLSIPDLGEALAGHPRIGERRDGGTGRAGATGAGRAESWSREEQARVVGAAELTSRALAGGNAAYEQRFGHIYLVCASGRSAEELLELLQARLANDAETEWQVVRSELKKINRIRLRKLIAGAA